MTASLLLAAAAFTARGEIVWLESSYDFGLMKEIAGPRTGSVRFVNRGPGEVTVVAARPSCGCTSSTYPEEPVAPGDTATITFTYDPDRLPGRFDKTVKVRFADGARKTIRITGNVLGAPESVARYYPAAIGSLCMDTDRVLLGNVTAGRLPASFVKIYNQSTDSISAAASSACKALSHDLSASKAGPGDILTLALTLDTRAYATPGPFEIPVQITETASGGETSSRTIRVTGTIIPARPAVLPADLSKAPRAVAIPPMCDLGNLQGDAVSVQLHILNEGKKQLNVIRVWSDNPALVVTDTPKTVKSGHNADISGTLDLRALRTGPFRFDVNVATDDPVNPLLKYTVAGIKE